MATKILYVRLDTELHGAVAELAKANDRTINKQAIRLLKKGLGLTK